jgi:hypothetical protein
MKIEEEKITERFVSVYYELKAQGVVDTKREFCAHVEITPSNFAIVERGDRMCHLGQICALINHWRVNPTWLMTGTGSMFYHPARG